MCGRFLCIRPRIVSGGIFIVINITSKKKEQEIQKDIAATYNAYKKFEGRQYTGMKVGGGHKWHYDQGEWKEKKVTPDK